MRIFDNMQYVNIVMFKVNIAIALNNMYFKNLHEV